ncbi:MAG: signal peptide peptidase SppA [bacterium]
MKQMVFVLVASFAVFIASNAYSQESGYFDFLLTSPGSMAYGLYGYENPAMVKNVDHMDILFAWSNPNDLADSDDIDRWGVFTAIPGAISFGAIHQRSGSSSATDYRLGLGVGDRSKSFGFGYGWSKGEMSKNRSNLIIIGSLFRPIPHLSVGVWGNSATKGDEKRGFADIGIRPLASPLVTLFADYSIAKGQRVKDGWWSAGGAFEILPGLRVTGRYFSDHRYSLGLSIGLGRLTTSTQAYYTKDDKYDYSTYAVRVGGIDRSLIGKRARANRNYLHITLKGPIKYQRFRLFDKSQTLLGLLHMIDAAKEDPSIAGIAIHAADMQANWELAWEIREKLKEFKKAGKHVVVYLENVSFAKYHFASVADKVVMDPTATMELMGMRFGRYYLKGTLEKLGIGFDELRFFKYKSAYETFARDSMSEGDREQLQAILEDFYDLVRQDVCESRRIEPDEFDNLVNDGYLFLPDQAVEAGLVDTLAKWDDIGKVIEKLEGRPKKLVGPTRLARYSMLRDDYWGEKPRIAVIYALGECAMDQGIKARSLSKVIKDATGDRKIKAVVFRVDSPGGTVTSSDLVAEALKKCSEKKPVIVSQGWVAGSGGYWISMYGDKIVAAPNTITGSIGVIGGYIYNKGLKGKLGMTTDVIKAGKHSDFGFGPPIPFLGVLPDRPMSDEERAKAEYGIKKFYNVFVDKVAAARHTEGQKIEKIAQGRIWSGTDGLSVGLVDEIGGIETAIEIARSKAGIREKKNMCLVEMPEPPLIDTSKLMPKLIGVKNPSAPTNPVLEDLRFRIDHNGEIMPILPFEIMEALRGFGEPAM